MNSLAKSFDPPVHKSVNSIFILTVKDSRYQRAKHLDQERTKLAMGFQAMGNIFYQIYLQQRDLDLVKKQETYQTVVHIQDFTHQVLDAIEQ